MKTKGKFWEVGAVKTRVTLELREGRERWYHNFSPKEAIEIAIALIAAASKVDSNQEEPSP